VSFKDVRFNVIMYVANKLVTHIPSRRLRRAYYRYVLDLKIADSSGIFMGTRFDSRHNFELGENSVILQNCRMDNRGSIKIGSCVSISEDVTILTADHDVQSSDFRGRERAVEISSYAFLGTRCIILPGVKIGTGAVVAAGSVVSRDVADYDIVAGAPARPIGKRNNALDYKINYTRWLF
jgi:acetyltransferase-like isoleucine patch superfamily enzyme